MSYKYKCYGFYLNLSKVFFIRSSVKNNVGGWRKETGESKQAVWKKNVNEAVKYEGFYGISMKEEAKEDFLE